MIKDHLNNTLDHVEIPEHMSAYAGKVRHCFDTKDGYRAIVTSDRLSAFDRQVTTIPFKGEILTAVSEFWFKETSDICPNHMISRPDANIMVCRNVDILPVEVVVRGYLAGSTATSLLTQYKQGQRHIYGFDFPDGMVDHQKLEAPIITPTTKDDEHDLPLTSQQILDDKILDPETWQTVQDYALALFARGQQIAQKNGLILADTKYEFGRTSDGQIVVADEVHTPDSSRYWIASSYAERLEAGLSPQTLDKDMIRRWLVERCDPYKDDLPVIPDDIRVQTSEVYLELLRIITGQEIDVNAPRTDIKQRVHDVIASL